MRIRVEFNPSDLWIGAYTDVRAGKVDDWPYPVYERPFRHLWICVLPMLPIHLSWEADHE